MQDSIFNKDFKLCIELIEKWFRYDTFIFLDCVLTDDENNPEYSANTVYKYFSQIVIFQNQYYGKNYKSVEDFLLANGYSIDDINLLKNKRISEDARHTRH